MKNDAEPHEVFSGIANMVDQLAAKLNGDVVNISKQVVLVVSVEVEKERRDLFLEVILANAKGSRSESGCLRWDLLQDTEDDCKFTF